MAAQAGNGLRGRLRDQSEEKLGRILQEVLENPLVHRAVDGAFGARAKAAEAQQVAMGAFNLPSAGDIERLTRRVRSLSQRVEGLEDALERVERRLTTLTDKLDRKR